MSRNRLRRSFTVEAKSGSQQSHVSIPARTPKTPSAARKSGTGDRPAAAQDTPHEAFQDIFKKTAPPAAPVENRRVLPSLIAPPEPVEEEAARPEREPPLPRVRRASELILAEPRRRGRPPKRAAVEVPVPAAPAPPPAERPAAALAAPAGELARTPPSTPRARRGRDEPVPAFKLGERWKRRLPRACW